MTSLEECRTLWDRFSPRRTLFDVWEYPFSFLSQFSFPLHFVHLTESGDSVGLVPLWFHPEQQRYLWFGDIGDEFHWMEERDFWVRDGIDVREVLELIPKPFCLNNLTASAATDLAGDARVSVGNPKHVLSLSGFQNADSYIETQDRKMRSNLRRERRQIEAKSPQIVFDRFSDLEPLVAFNRRKFSDSPFHDVRMVKVFECLIAPGLESTGVRVRMMSVIVDFELVAVDLVFLFEDTYYPLLCGYDVGKCSGIGNYMTLLDIEDALKLGMKRIDFAESDPVSYKDDMFPRVEQFTVSS